MNEIWCNNIPKKINTIEADITQATLARIEHLISNHLGIGSQVNYGTCGGNQINIVHKINFLTIMSKIFLKG